jgi:hypothetical protein
MQDQQRLKLLVVVWILLRVGYCRQIRARVGFICPLSPLTTQVVGLPIPRFLTVL